MTKRRSVAALVMVLALCAARDGSSQTPAPEHAREVKYVRDSEEYATITRWVYRSASAAVEAAARRLPRGRPWAVVLDVDETALDNTAYELERRAYGQPHDEDVWAAFLARRESGAVPGVVEFVAAVRRLGGRVAWNTNRLERSRDDTRATLELRGLWADGDRLCMMPAAGDTTYAKRVRRAEAASGNGRCGWGEPVTILAFVGDQLGDFPRAGEGDPDAGREEAFGVRYFLLPNPMYGGWERRVTRLR